MPDLRSIRMEAFFGGVVATILIVLGLVIIGIAFRSDDGDLLGTIVVGGFGLWAVWGGIAVYRRTVL